ncbi:MAG TPA: DUF922 domain-containing protein [Gemmatimonadales bacterium]|nr:DUF922 domain-containing protein [Gemmatimonadales bacterium]
MRPAVRSAALAAAIAASRCASAPVRPAPPPAPVPAVAPGARAVAALSIESRDRYYDITGSSAAQLREAMRQLGPHESGTPRDALTAWHLEWTYRQGRRADDCALRDVRVTLDVTVTLPRWEPATGAPARLVESWNSFLEHVKAHEAGHRAIAERYARDLVAALTALRGATCADVWDEASRTASRIVEEGRAKNRAYDVATKHGQTQGVVLAP